MAQPIVINLHTNKYIEGLCCYPFAFNLDRCMGSCNTLNDLSNKAYVPNKTEDLNGPKILTKHISCECKYKFDGRKCNLNQMWNNDKS